ncbi:hypothetical protein [Streptomyces sp. NPDC050548]
MDRSTTAAADSGRGLRQTTRDGPTMSVTSVSVSGGQSGATGSVPRP